ncbi:MAG: cysteine desulfurase family protein [Alphaproteobacteria bacterium]
MSSGPVTAVYLDHQATTPVDPRVLDAMLPYFSERFGNPHSKHAFGSEAADGVSAARAQVAACIGASPREIVFTSGATESNNLVIKGVTDFHRNRGGDHLIVAATEHKCVLESARAAAVAGTRVSILPVQSNGLIDLADLEAAIEDNTALVSIMAVNNEIGVIQPIAEIGRLCRRHKVLFHTDAAQAIGKIAIDVEAMNIDLLSISGHKIYGPMGIGAAYIRRRPRARLAAQISGGGQERGMRSGTLPVALCVGLGLACELAAAELATEGKRLAILRERFHGRLLAAVSDAVLHGDAQHRIAANLNLGFQGVDAQAIVEQLDDVALSTGSACTAASVEPSYVLRALGVDDAIARASVRIGLGRFTTEAEVDFAADRLAQVVRQLRNETPRHDAARAHA